MAKGKDVSEPDRRGEECISNSYGSITCIRFEGMISARGGHPFDFTAQR